MKKNLPIVEIVVVTLALAAGVGIYWYAHRDEGRLEESKQRGAIVVEGLEAYRAQHGTYPEALEELVPQYAPRIEAPTWGLERWRYRRFTPEDVATMAAAAAVETSPPDRQTPDPNPGEAARTAPPGEAARIAPPDEVYFQLSVAANASGYPVLYYDLTARRWVLNN
ncbi:hypothetical protein BH23GEM9_BH23GEM9_22080 [soil metagenome]